MDEKPTEQTTPGLNRRAFIGAMAGAAAAGALVQLGGNANAQSQAYYYQDSFGDVVPAGQGAIDLGIYPPPVIGLQLQQPQGVGPNDDPPPVTCYPGNNNTTFYSCGYPKYNILMIIVDQMRNPAFWLPAGNATVSGQALVNQAIPNISTLAGQSLNFPNYWVAATVCGPSRACLLTGLYSQQHCIFSSQAAGSGTGNSQPPPLLPFNTNWTRGSSGGFPTIANVLSQKLPYGNNAGNNMSYDCTFIGKWHLSCYTGQIDNNPGQNGPGDYGFNSTFCLPNSPVRVLGKYPSSANGYPSPNGSINEGIGGDFIDSLSGMTRDVPTYNNSIGNNTVNNNWQQTPLVQINDAAIADAFVNYWLPNAVTQFNNNTIPLPTPWFCTVSFVNPHDITDFPYPFGLSYNNTGNFGLPMNLSGYGFQPPPVSAVAASFNGTNCLGGNCIAANDVMYVANFSAPYGGLPPGNGNNAPWNWEDLTSPALQPGVNGKPGLQQWFMDLKNSEGGSINGPGSYNSGNGVWSTPAAWTLFLNYYLWLESCVDYQVGRVLGTNPSNNTGLAQTPFAPNTVVIFTSDHGDYAGSHGLHAKGGALYEEVMNVPLYISYPSQRNGAQTGATIPYVCSSVDLLPFLYTLALGNSQWRNNNGDMAYHLANREAIEDAIYQFNGNSSNTAIIQQRRISSIPLHNNAAAGCVSACKNWQTSQPFVLHTADDYPVAMLPGSNYQPSHAIAFRTVDLTDKYNNSAPFSGLNTYGGGKLGIYNYWNTCGQNAAPIMSTNNSGNQFEFYNYSPNPPAGSTLLSNLQEIGNQYSNSSGAAQVQLYYNDFFGIGSPSGLNVQNELYVSNVGTSSNNAPAQQVRAAIQIAFQNYRAYLNNSSPNVIVTGPNGTPVSSKGSCNIAGNGGPYLP